MRSIRVVLFWIVLALVTSYVLSVKTADKLENHKNYHLLPKDCGVSYTDRIIGGKTAALGQYPWLARLGFLLPGCTTKVLYRCGGALINNLYVLTAAHCTTDLPSIRCPTNDKDTTFILGSIILGEYNTDDNPDCEDDVCAEPIQHFKPKRIFVHPSYNKPQYANDVSLIRLNRKAKLNGWVSPICLPRGKLLTKHYVGYLMEVAGWGATNVTKPNTSKLPMFVKLPTLDTPKCLRSFNVKLSINSTSQLCVGGEENKDSCGGDSGGPLMHVETNGDSPRYYALGLVSFGVKHCGKKDKPAIYTRIAAFMHWILEHMAP
ncbi:hypothetical protein Trydic_g4233 [Trypoxylus dichotomus]